MIAILTLIVATAGAEVGPTVEYTLPETVIAIQAQKREGRKVWACGAPRDIGGGQTVKACEWRNVPVCFDGYARGPQESCEDAAGLLR